MATILIIDDSATNRQLLVALLAHTGHQTFEAADGLEGLGVARAQRPDLIISDILMPTMDGYEFVRQLRADPELAETKVIFNTAHFREVEARNLAEACGVSTVLLKPSDPEDVLRTILSALTDAPAKHSPLPVEFDREHLRLVTDKLAYSEIELRALNARLSALTEINVLLASTPEPRALLESLCRHARELLGARYAVLCAREKLDHNNVFCVTSGIDAATVAGMSPTDIEGGILGAMLAGRKPCRLENLPADPAALGLPAGCPAGSVMLAAPIVSLNSSFGWICLIDKIGAQEFTTDDERMLGVLAAQAGRIYENGSLYAELQRHASRLEAEVAERERIGQALRASEGKYRELIEQASDGITLIDAHGVFNLVNSRFCEMLGYGEAELLGANVAITYPQDDPDQPAWNVKKVIDHGEGMFQRSMRRRDGSLMPAEVTARRLSNGMIQAITRDVSARQAAEEALAQSEQRFRQLAENIHEVFWLTDPTKNEMLYVSPGYERTWGRTCAELYASPLEWLEAIHPDDRERIVDAARTKQAAGTYDEEYRIRRPDGTIRWIRDRAFPIADANGKLFRIAGIAEDITDAKNASDELRESQRRFSDMLSNLELVALMLDRDARITYANDHLLKLTGRRREEVVGKNWVDLFLPPEVREKLHGVHNVLLAEAPKGRHNENEILTSTGERKLIHWNNSVLRSAAGDVVGTASIGEDITERKIAEDRIQRLNRVYAMMSGINAVIVRERSPDALYREACRIAVDAGAFRMAWIAKFDAKTNKGQMSVSYGGEVGAFDLVRLSTSTTGSENAHPACRALRELGPVVCNDTRSDATLTPWRDELLQRQDLSLACFPLMVGNRPVAVVALFAARTGTFDDEEVGLLRELTDNLSFTLDHIEKEKKLDYLAYYDPVTGLPNRNLFRTQLTQHLRAAEREENKVAVVVMDINRFRGINETLGRAGGDQLLQMIAERARKDLPDAILVSRLGADQFALVSSGMKLADDAARTVEMWERQLFGAPFAVRDAEFRLAARFGIAIFPDDGNDAELMLKNAEAALRRAKTGRQRHLFYTKQMAERIAERMALDGRLQRALVNRELLLHYQPKVDLESGRIVGVEALLRWLSPETGLVPPLEFIPLMEENGMILEVGAWVMRQAAADHCRWLDLGLPAPRIAVNVSPLQLRQKDFVETLVRSVGTRPTPPAIDLELTETLIMDDIAGNIEKLSEIRRLGISIAIDDFGTGYSSLAYLAKLPTQALKIDRSFVITMLEEPDTMALVGTIISLAHSLRLKVIAEGVETIEQARMLRLLRCDEMQGYLYSRPLPFDAMTALLDPKNTPNAGWR